MQQITDVQIFCKLRYNINYTGDMFLYCPWCGKKLEEIDEEEKDESRTV